MRRIAARAGSGRRASTECGRDRSVREPGSQGSGISWERAEASIDVVLDGNHPLAGIAIRMHVTVRGVRAATDKEIEDKSVQDDAAGLLQVLAPPKDKSQLH